MDHAHLLQEFHSKLASYPPPPRPPSQRAAFLASIGRQNHRFAGNGRQNYKFNSSKNRRRKSRGMRKIWSGLTLSRAHCWWCAHTHSSARGLRPNAFAPPNACFGAYFCKYLGGLLELRALIYTGFKNFTAVPTCSISGNSNLWRDTMPKVFCSTVLLKSATPPN